MIQSATDIETPRDFERLLREGGFSRARAKAITAKGFKSSKLDDADIAKLIDVLNCKRDVLQQKRGKLGIDALLRLFETARTPINTVSVYPGDTKEFIIAPVKTGRVKFTIRAPDWAHFKCTIYYMVFSHGVPMRDEVVLYSDAKSRVLSATVDRGSPPAFNPLSLDDWRRQYSRQRVLDGTRAVLEHKKHPEDAIRNLPQRPGRFTIRAS